MNCEFLKERGMSQVISVKYVYVVCGLFPGTDIFDMILLCLLGINYCMSVGGRQNLISQFKNCKCPPLSLSDYWQQNHRLI